MKSQSSPEFAAYIGIDWANDSHQGALQAEGSESIESFTLRHTPDAIDQWARSLIKRFKGRPIAVCLELTKGPLVYALAKYDSFVLHPVNPQSLARYREAFAPSGAKDDPTDSELQLDMLRRHRDKLTPLKPQSPTMRALLQLVESRRRLVDDSKRIVNRLQAALKNYFPQALQCFSDRNSLIFCDFLQRWPTLKAARLARTTTLERFFRDHHVRRKDVIDKRIECIRNAVPLTHDEAIIQPQSLLVVSLVSQLRATLLAIREFDQHIEELAHQHPDFQLFKNLPGAGPALAPRLLVAFGEDRKRFPNATDIQCYSAVAPVTERSGNSEWVHWRFRCSKFVRQSFVEWAAKTIGGSFWARAYYYQQRSRGKSHNAAVRALAFKWIRILHRCWRDRVPYDETTYLNALKERGSPLLKNIA